MARAHPPAGRETLAAFEHERAARFGLRANSSVAGMTEGEYLHALSGLPPALAPARELRIAAVELGVARRNRSWDRISAPWTKSANVRPWGSAWRRAQVFAWTPVAALVQKGWAAGQLESSFLDALPDHYLVFDVAFTGTLDEGKRARQGFPEVVNFRLLADDGTTLAPEAVLEGKWGSRSRSETSTTYEFVDVCRLRDRRCSCTVIVPRTETRRWRDYDQEYRVVFDLLCRGGTPRISSSARTLSLTLLAEDRPSAEVRFDLKQGGL
jgi:hypothetical protein